MIEVPPIAGPPEGNPLDVLVRFAGALRKIGLFITTDRLGTAAELLGHWRLAGDTEPYWPLRVAFCSSEADLLRFDAAYRHWFDNPSADDGGQHSVTVPARTPITGDDDGTGTALDDADSGAGNATELATRDFDDLTDAQLQEVSAWAELLRPVPRRHAMNHRPARSGYLDTSRTMRLMLRNNGELLRPRYRRTGSRPLRVLVLVDVSASMRPYSDVLLHLGYATLRANPDTAEVFAVGTQFTRLTEPLRTGRIDVALRAAGEVRTDWAKGTTLGVALRDLLQRWGGSRAVRSAIVVLCSDGFEFHDPALLIAQAGRLAALSRTFIWVDPGHRGSLDRPVDGHVARAQDHATTVLGCHSYAALRKVAKVMTNA